MSKDRLPLRVVRAIVDGLPTGGFVPAYAWVEDYLREKAYTVDSIVYASFSQPRNPKFHRLVHVFGEMIKNNIPGFEYLDSHQVLKRIQVEADIACDHVAMIMPGIGPVTYRMPQSMAFDAMTEEKFKEMFKNMAMYVAENYWPGLTPEQVEEQRLLIDGPDQNGGE